MGARTASTALERALRVAALTAILCVLWAGTALAKPRADRTPDGRLLLEYWDNWSGHEMAAMRAVVDDFNASRSRIHADFICRCPA